MSLHHEQITRDLLRGDAAVTIRPMTREDIPAMRRFDDELTLTLDDVNAQYPPDGHSTCAGGPWSCDDWLGLHFEKYESSGNLTLLAHDDAGRVVGFADLWAADEPEPFGRSLSMECIDSFREYYLAGLETLLLAEAEKVARAAESPALDIGTNTCSGDYVALRRFGLKVFYEYDDVLCGCAKPPKEARPERRMLTPDRDHLNGLVRVFHFAPTDFTFEEPSERTYVAELTWPDLRAVLELLGPELDNYAQPVPPNAPEKAHLYVEPAALESSEAMSRVLAECAALADEAGAESIKLPCPSETALDEFVVDVRERQYAFSWLRKAL